MSLSNSSTWPGCTGASSSITGAMPATGRSLKSYAAIAVQAESWPQASATRAIGNSAMPEGIWYRPRTCPPGRVIRSTNENARKCPSMRFGRLRRRCLASCGRPLPADHQLAKGFGCEQFGDFRVLLRAVEPVGRHFAQKFAHPRHARLGDDAGIFKFSFREVPARRLHDLAAGDLHLKFTLEAEDDVEKIDGLCAQLIDERGFRHHGLNVTAERVGDDVGHLRVNGVDLFLGDYFVGHNFNLSIHLEPAVHVQYLA